MTSDDFSLLNMIRQAQLELQWRSLFKFPEVNSIQSEFGILIKIMDSLEIDLNSDDEKIIFAVSKKRDDKLSFAGKFEATFT